MRRDALLHALWARWDAPPLEWFIGAADVVHGTNFLVPPTGRAAAVVSVPCFELFAEQEAGYRAAVVGEAPRIGIEAALRLGWDAVLRPEDGFIGMTGFGASAPAGDLFKAFGITVDAIVAAARTAAR